MPHPALLSASVIVLIGFGTLPSVAGVVACVAPASAEPDGASLARDLCAAVEAAVRARLSTRAADPAPLVVEVLALRRNGFDARLGWRTQGGIRWGPVLTSSSIDADGIAPGAAEGLAAALLKVTPIPVSILSPASPP